MTFVALARAQSNDNLRRYLDRHGIAGLATALESARASVRGATNARVGAQKVGSPVLEAETTLEELREILVETFTRLRK